MQERKGVITFQGNPLTLLGPGLKVGDKAPGFSLLNNQLQAVTQDAYKGKTLLLSVAPSLDTPVCAIQTKKFNGELKALGDKATIVTVTADLPFAQARFCGAEGLTITTLSDHKAMSFGDAYGTHIQELRIETRALFVVGKDGTLKHVQYVGEITQEPDYAPALAALKADA